MMKTPRSLWIVLLAAVAFALLFTGCTKPGPEDKISARDDESFENWIAAHRDVLTLKEVTELNEARQQLRYKIMTQQPGLMSADSVNALYGEINGKTPRELLTESYELQTERAQVDLKNYAPLLAQYQGYGQNGVLTDEQKQDVKAKLDQLNEKIAIRQKELDTFQKRLAELKPGAAPTK